MMLRSVKVLVVGGGNMGGAMIGGFINAGMPTNNITVIQPSEEKGKAFEKMGVNRLAKAPEKGTWDVVLFAVKPQIMLEIMPEYSKFLTPETLVISIAAGVEMATIRKALGGHNIVVRVMPNMPSSIGHGVAAMVSDKDVAEPQRKLATEMMSCTGEVVWISDEKYMDVVTGISGSGPAYFYLMIEALTEAGKKAGLPEAVAERLATYTAQGTGEMAAQMLGKQSAKNLRASVTSPGGTTHAALEKLKENHFERIVMDGVDAAAKRAVILSGNKK